VGAVAVPDLSNQALWVASPARAFRMDVVAGKPLELADRLEEDWTLLWLAGGAAVTSAAMLGGGVWATQRHNDLVAEMNVGTVDRREAIADWADGATAMYVSAGALAVAAVGLWLLDWVMTPAETEPLFLE